MAPRDRLVGRDAETARRLHRKYGPLLVTMAVMDVVSDLGDGLTNAEVLAEAAKICAGVQPDHPDTPQ